MAELEAKAAEYLSKRIRLRNNLDQVGLAIPKSGDILPGTTNEQAPGQSVVEVTPANHQVYYQGLRVSLPMTFAGRQFYRTITDEAFILSDMFTGEIVFAFPLPMVAIKDRKRTVASYVRDQGGPDRESDETMDTNACRVRSRVRDPSDGDAGGFLLTLVGSGASAGRCVQSSEIECF